MPQKQPQKSVVKKNGNGKKPVKLWMFSFNLNLKNIFIGLFVLFILFSLFGSIAGQSGAYPEKPLSTVITDVKSGKVTAIEVEDTKLTVSYKDGTKITSHKETQESMVKLLEDAGATASGVSVTVKDMSVGAIWMGIISNVLPLVLTVLFFTVQFCF